MYCVYPHSTYLPNVVWFDIAHAMIVHAHTVLQGIVVGVLHYIVGYHSVPHCGYAGTANYSPNFKLCIESHLMGKALPLH